MIPERIAVVSPCPACLLPSDAFSIWVQHHPAFLTKLIMRSSDQPLVKSFQNTLLKQITVIKSHSFCPDIKHSSKLIVNKLN